MRDRVATATVAELPHRLLVGAISCKWGGLLLCGMRWERRLGSDGEFNYTVSVSWCGSGGRRWLQRLSCEQMRELTALKLSPEYAN